MARVRVQPCPDVRAGRTRLSRGSRALRRASYTPPEPALFALLGTTFGGNGQTTFNLPVLRGRLALGFGQGTSNVVAAAVQEASLRGQIAATEEIIKIQTESLGILRKQFELGQVAAADVAAVEATLAQAEATLPPLHKQLAVQRDLLTALIGRLPNQEPAEKFELAALQLPLDLPVSLPSKLVEQRPDIQSAEAQLHAASASIGVAIAAQLPQFTLTGNAGTTASQINQLFIAPGTAFWFVAGNVAQTIFDAGTLLHKKRAADAAFDQAAETYRSTVVAAFQNVADTLHALQFDADALKATYAAERAAFTSLEIARRQLGSRSMWLCADPFCRLAGRARRRTRHLHSGSSARRGIRDRPSAAAECDTR